MLALSVDEWQIFLLQGLRTYISLSLDAFNLKSFWIEQK
jgi:hypothetical protein